jgi:hypothetical protein
MGAFVDVAVIAISAVMLGFVVYGGWLVAGGGGFHRDAPEDPCHPQLDLSHDL